MIRCCEAVNSKSYDLKTVTGADLPGEPFVFRCAINDSRFMPHKGDDAPAGGGHLRAIAVNAELPGPGALGPRPSQRREDTMGMAGRAAAAHGLPFRCRTRGLPFRCCTRAGRP